MSRYRSSDAGDVVKAVIVAIAWIIFAAITKAWAFMLLIGAAHSHDARIPAFSFITSFFVALAIQVAAYQYNAAKTD